MDRFYDTHAHLAFPQFEGDREEVLERAVRAGVVAVINVGTDEISSRRAVELASRHKIIWAAVGIHPHFAAGASPGCWDLLSDLAVHPRVLAVGETGFDFYRNLSPREGQERLFRGQLRLARRLNKPVIVHCRSAMPDTLAVLREEFSPNGSGIMHCFSGNPDQARALTELGFYLSLAGTVTYPRSHALRVLLKEIPPERLLLETDAPYLSPQPYRNRRNEPAFIAEIYRRVALELGMTVTSLARRIEENIYRLFPVLAG